MGYKITKETILEVKKYASKYPELTQEDLAKFVGVSPASVSNILRGTYDDFIEEQKIESQIPYETYRRLVMCEEAVKEIFRNTKVGFDEEDTLFIDYHILSAILERCLPEDFHEKINELKIEKRF